MANQQTYLWLTAIHEKQIRGKSTLIDSARLLEIASDKRPGQTPKIVCLEEI